MNEQTYLLVKLILECGVEHDVKRGRELWEQIDELFTAEYAHRMVECNRACMNLAVDQFIHLSRNLCKLPFLSCSEPELKKWSMLCVHDLMHLESLLNWKGL